MNAYTYDYSHGNRRSISRRVAILASVYADRPVRDVIRGLKREFRQAGLVGDLLGARLGLRGERPPRSPARAAPSPDLTDAAAGDPMEAVSQAEQIFTTAVKRYLGRCADLTPGDAQLLEALSREILDPVTHTSAVTVAAGIDTAHCGRLAAAPRALAELAGQSPSSDTLEQMADDSLAACDSTDQIHQRLERLCTRIESFRSAYAMDPRLLTYVVSRQSEYLESGDPQDLKPLSKADVVTALDLLPSTYRYVRKTPPTAAGGNTPDAQESRADRGRRITRGRLAERRIGTLVSQYPAQNRTLALRDLVPGAGAMKKINRRDPVVHFRDCRW